MSAHVLLNLLNELRKGDNESLAEHFIPFHKFYKFNSTDARIYHMALKVF